MTFRIKDGPIVIAAENSAACEMCGKHDELRPYGPNGANVCFDCAMKDKANAAAMFKRRLAGD
jgi:hypothetical protein